MIVAKKDPVLFFFIRSLWGIWLIIHRSVYLMCGRYRGIVHFPLSMEQLSLGPLADSRNGGIGSNRGHSVGSLSWGWKELMALIISY